MIKEKNGKPLTWARLNRRFFLNHPLALWQYKKIKRIAPYTMLSYTALYNAYNHVAGTVEQGISGAIVEMGCWNGGCGAFMGRAVKDHQATRDIWLFDSFEGLPELTKEDKQWAKQLEVEVQSEVSEQKPIGLYVANEENVRQAFAALSVPTENLHIEKGWFQKTVPLVKDKIGPIAVLRLDGDTYDSTKYCLEELYPQVAKGGVVIIDDFHLEGCRQALYEYFAESKIYPVIKKEPYGGRLHFVKK